MLKRKQEGEEGEAEANDGVQRKKLKPEPTAAGAESTPQAAADPSAPPSFPSAPSGGSSAPAFPSAPSFPSLPPLPSVCFSFSS